MNLEPEKEREKGERTRKCKGWKECGRNRESKGDEGEEERGEREGNGMQSSVTAW